MNADQESVEGVSSRWLEPKATPKPEDYDALLVAPPPVVQIRRRLVISVLVAAAAAGVGSVAYAVTNRTHHVKAEKAPTIHKLDESGARMPEAFRALGLATTPATNDTPSLTTTRPMETAPQSAVDALPVARGPVPPIAAAYDEGAVVQGEDYTPRNYTPRRYRSRVSSKPTDDGESDDSDHNSDEADLPSRETVAGKQGGGSGLGQANNAPSLPLGQAPTMLQPPQTGDQVGKLAQALASAAADGDDDNKKERFMARDGIPTLDSAEDDLAECDLSAGRPIPANILVAINSDLPSGNTVTARVSETVYCGADREHVAIPQGSTFTGEVNHSVVYGQERVQLCMKQLERPPSAGHPKGSRKQLGCMVVADITGASGMPADVDNHWGQLISGALLSTVLSLGTSASMGNQEGFAPTLAQNAARSAGANISQVGQRVVQRDLQRKPTLKTEQLEGVMIMFTSNLELDPWTPRNHRRR